MRLNGRSSERRQWIDRELSVIGVFFFEIIFWFYFRVTISEDIEKAGNNLFNLYASKFGAYPDNETCYFRHTLVSFVGCASF